MAFVANSLTTFPEIASNDITVYLFGEISDNSIFTSYFHKQSHVINKKTPFIDLDSVIQPNYKVIVPEGYHSCGSKRIINSVLYGVFNIVKGIIPKGAKYYYNAKKDVYISSCIIMTESIGRKLPL